MKRIISAGLAILMLLGIFLVPLTASAATFNDKIEILGAMGIMNGDENGNLNLRNNVTRAEFTKMLITASPDKNKAEGVTNVSPFSDVPSSHWAAGYVKTAANNALIVGYLDGTFKPDATIKLEEAVSIVLKQLGYLASDLEGSYPQGHIAKYESLELDDGINADIGEYLTREDCANLIYNMLTAKTKSGTAYALTLGYRLDSAGDLDLTTVVNSTMTGPYIITDSIGLRDIVTDINTVTITKNSDSIAVSDVKEYDVVYYSEELNKIWCYDNKVTGMLTQISNQNSANGTMATVTVNNKLYAVSSSSAQFKLSTLGEFTVGDYATLIIDRDSLVIDVLPTEVINSATYGIITQIAQLAHPTDNNSTVNANTAVVTTTTGAIQQVKNPPSHLKVGDTVEITYEDGQETLRRVGSDITATVNDSATYAGTRPIANDVKILETSGYNTGTIHKISLANLELTTNNTLFHALNERGEIEHLILKDATGDQNTYCVVTNSQETMTPSIFGSYVYDVKGRMQTHQSTSTIFNITVGPAVIADTAYNNFSIKNLKGERPSEFFTNTVRIGSDSYLISPDVVVYELKDNQYAYTTEEIDFNENIDDIKVFYDDSIKQPKIRVIVVEVY